jgi:hypothetical protein
VYIWASTRSASLWSWASIPWDCGASTPSASEAHRLWGGVGGSSAEKRWRCAFAEELGRGVGGGGGFARRLLPLRFFFFGWASGLPFLSRAAFFSLNFYFFLEGSVPFLLSFCLQIWGIFSLSILVWFFVFVAWLVSHHPQWVGMGLNTMSLILNVSRYFHKVAWCVTKSNIRHFLLFQ